MKRLRIPGLFIALATLPACPESADIATGDMRAVVNVRIQGEDRDVEVRADLYEGADGEFSIELTGGDQLLASIDGGDPVTLEDRGGAYQASLSTNTGEVRVELARESGDNGSIAQMIPDPIALETAALSLADDPVTVIWSNPVEGATVVVFVDSCAQVELETPEEKEPSEDTGSYSLTRAEIEGEAGANANCAQLVFERYVSNEETTGFHEASSMRIERRDRIEVQLTP